MIKFIFCACGCNRKRPKFDKRGRERRYIIGHGNRNYKPSKETIEKLRRNCRPPTADYSSKIEKIVKEQLDKLNIVYASQKAFKIRDQIRSIDIFIPPKTIVEIDGDFWHSKMINVKGEIGSLRNDYIIDYELEKQGYIVRRYWETDINNNLQWVINQILKTIGKNGCKINEEIYCKCGCGMMTKRYDYRGRTRQYIHNHHRRWKKNIINVKTV